MMTTLGFTGLVSWLQETNPSPESNSSMKRDLMVNQF